jgi:hypothetical protein
MFGGRAMGYRFQVGDRVRLSARGRQIAKKALRTGVVMTSTRSRTQFNVLWEGVRTSQVIHIDLLELATSERELLKT